MQTALGSIFVCDGEIAVTAAGIGVRRGNGVLLHTGVLVAALDGIAPVQLNNHITVALDFNGSATSCAGVNIHAAQGDINGGTGGSVYGDPVARGSAFIALDHGHAAFVRILLCRAVLGMRNIGVIDSHIALADIRLHRKSCQGQGGCQKQRHHTR